MLAVYVALEELLEKENYALLEYFDEHNLWSPEFR